MWSLEKLKDWARPALRHEELIKIARTASSAKQAKNQALDFARNSGFGEEETKACRWLMIIRRNYGQEIQEEYISSTSEEMAQKSRKSKLEEKEVEKKKNQGNVRFVLPVSTEIITKESITQHFLGYDDTGGISKPKILNVPTKETSIRFGVEGDLERVLVEMLRDINSSMFAFWPNEEEAGKEVIQLLEEKFGLKVKVCGNCNYFKVDSERERSDNWWYQHYPPRQNPFGRCFSHDTMEKQRICESLPKTFNNEPCDHWTPPKSKK